jgi:hypothetical protein
MVSAVLLIVGITAIGSQWHGNLGLNVGWPAPQNAVKFSGEAVGVGALVGIVTLIPGIILFLIALIVGVLQETQSLSDGHRSVR